MRDDCIAVALGLPQLKLVWQKESEGHIEVTVIYRRSEAACPRCGKVTRKEHDRRKQQKQDRILELKEQARLSEIRQKAAETGALAARPASEARRNQALVEYGERIEAIIKSNWVYVLTGQDTGLRTKIRVMVLSNGTIIIIRVDEPSGDRAFDRSALRAIKRTAKLVIPGHGNLILNL